MGSSRAGWGNAGTPSGAAWTPRSRSAGGSVKSRSRPARTRSERSRVPAEHDGGLALPAEHRDGGRVEPQMTSVGHRQLQPAGGEGPQRVAVAEDEDAPVDGAAAVDDAVEPGL